MGELKKITEKIGRIKHTGVLALIFIVGVILLVLPVGHDAKQPEPIEKTDISDYKKETEQALEAILSDVKGVGKAEVMITFSDNGKTFFATDEQSEGKTEQEEKQSASDTAYVLKNDAGGGQSPLITKEHMPEVAGVLVIAPGAKEAVVRNEIISAVRAVLGVKAHRVEVLERK